MTKSVSAKKTKSDEIETTVFKSGNSMAVRLPKGFQPKGKKLLISHTKEGAIILKEKPKPKTLGEALRSLPKFSDDFFKDGISDPPAKPEDFFDAD